jgi:hypothetical protein
VQRQIEGRGLAVDGDGLEPKPGNAPGRRGFVLDVEQDLEERRLGVVPARTQALDDRL